MRCVEKLDTGTSTGGIIDRTGDTGVDSVLVLGKGGVGSEKDDERRMTRDLSIASLLAVSAPVLSGQRTVTAANSSKAVIRVTMALSLASC